MHDETKTSGKGIIISNGNATTTMPEDHRTKRKSAATNDEGGPTFFASWNTDQTISLFLLLFQLQLLQFQNRLLMLLLSSACSFVTSSKHPVTLGHNFWLKIIQTPITADFGDYSTFMFYF